VDVNINVPGLGLWGKRRAWAGLALDGQGLSQKLLAREWTRRDQRQEGKNPSEASVGKRPLAKPFTMGRECLRSATVNGHLAFLP
jgi:hypothetical protein